MGEGGELLKETAQPESSVQFGWCINGKIEAAQRQDTNVPQPLFIYFPFRMGRE